jgi:hypothetical protein
MAMSVCRTYPPRSHHGRASGPERTSPPHHLTGELHRQFDFESVLGRVALAGGRLRSSVTKSGSAINLRKQKHSPGWSRREVLEANRHCKAMASITDGC